MRRQTSQHAPASGTTASALTARGTASVTTAHRLHQIAAARPAVPGQGVVQRDLSEAVDYATGHHLGLTEEEIAALLAGGPIPHRVHAGGVDNEDDDAASGAAGTGMPAITEAHARAIRFLGRLDPRMVLDMRRNIRFRGRNQRNPDFRKMIENPDRKRTENDLSDQLLQDPDAVNASIDNMHPDGIIGSDFPDYSPVAGNLHLRNGRSLSFFTGYLYQRDIPYSVGANKAFLDSLAARRATVHVHHPGRNGINKNLVESGRLPRRGEKTIDEMLADRRRKEVREGRGENFGTVDEAAHLMAEHSYTYHPISGEYGVLRPPPERDDDAAASSSSATSQTTTSNAAAAAQSKVAPPAAESDDD